MQSSTVHLASVTKRFSGHAAVKELSLDVSAGGIFGLLGPNGAGKSTTIRLIMGILQPDEGSVSLFGSSESSRKLSSRIGYLPEERGLYKKMEVMDHLIFLGEIKGLSRADSRRRAKEWLEKLGMAEWAKKKVEDLSKGMQQKVQFAGALLHEPDLVILDEPFSGLDPINAQVMKDIVVALASSGRTVLFSTHVMEQAERMCDRIAIIANGETVVSGTMAEVKAEFGGTHVALGFTHDKARSLKILSNREIVASFDDHGLSVDLQMANGAEPEQLLSALVHEGIGLRRFEVVEPSLQAIFIARAGGDAATSHGGEAV